MSPVPSANRAPLLLIPVSTPAWFTLMLPSLTLLFVVSPQSPKTANVNGVVLDALSSDLNEGEVSEPSRSTGVLPPVNSR